MISLSSLFLSQLFSCFSKSEVLRAKALTKACKKLVSISDVTYVAGMGRTKIGRVKLSCRITPKALARLQHEASDGPGKKPPIGELLSAIISTYSDSNWMWIKRKKLGWKYEFDGAFDFEDR